MAYTTAIRDHVWAITSDGTAGGITLGSGRADAQERWKAIRWLPAGVADTITIEGFNEAGTTIGVIWESAAGGATTPQESRVSLRATRGFKIVMTNGGKAYLYQHLDGDAAS